MKVLISIILGLSFIQGLPENDPREYFYFGNINLIGIGPLEDGKKQGAWKVYGRIEELEDPRITVEPVRDGDLVEYFDLTNPLYQINFKENLPDGIMEEFYPDGKIKKLVNFSEGKLNGDFFEFSKTGEVLLSGSYLDDQKSGDWISYFSNGNKKSEYSYLDNQLHGPNRIYYSNGVLAEIIPFEAGKLQGTYQTFFPNGTVQKTMEFDNDLEHGAFKYYFEDGRLEVSGSYAKGELEDNWENYDNFGQLIAYGTYQGGLKEGEWQEQIPEIQGLYRVGIYTEGNKTGSWKITDGEGFVYQNELFENGRLVSINEFTTPTGKVLDGGKLNKGKGKRIIYDREGNLLEKGRYSKGLRNGVWYTYYPQSDMIASSGSYVEGRKNGTWKYYDMTGELLSEDYFVEGQNSEQQEVSSVDNHLIDRKEYWRNQVGEPESSNDLRFLLRFKRPHVQQMINNF
ncbi:toxin-antitoxin system YwqK family antitoxin [Algoriphagus sp.]|uniref:toxin-antitoxin system YwqK family antitoxin n=1 Tax=Algoriphagus sp. TaxID=1872435 RepID=UPI0039195FCF